MIGDHPSWSGRPRVMPFYLICDVSLAMRYEMAALNGGLNRLWDAIKGSPALDDTTYVSVMTFSDDAKVAVPLTKVSQYTGGLPAFTHEFSPDYGSAFELLADELAADCNGLRQAGFDVHRPCAYFLTAGEPTDPDWHETFDETLTEEPLRLMGLSEPAIIVPFGFRDAPADVLRRLAYPGHVAKWYHARNATIEQALDGLLDIIQKSVLLSIQSGYDAMPGRVILPRPEPGSGITRHDAGRYDEG